MKKLIVFLLCFFMLSGIVHARVFPKYESNAPDTHSRVLYGKDSDGNLVAFKVTADGKVETTFSGRIVLCDTFTSDGINACIDELDGNAGVILLFAGTYVVDSTILMDNDAIQIIGSGWGTILDASAWTATGHIVNLNGKDDCVLQNFQILGNAGNGDPYDLLNDGNAAALRNKIVNVSFLNSDQYSIRLDNTGSNHNTISDCYFNNSDLQHVRVESQYNIIEKSYFEGGLGGIRSTNSFNEMVNNKCLNSSDIGIFGSANNIINNNLCASNAGRGISVTGVSQTLQGNVAYLNGNDGIYVQSGHSSTISGNTVVQNGNGAAGISVFSSNYVAVVGNTCEGATNKEEYGIELLTVTYSGVSGNTTTNHDTAGILADANSTNNQILDNPIESEDVAKIIDNGTNNIIRNVNTAGQMDYNHIIYTTGANFKSDRPTGGQFTFDWLENGSRISWLSAHYDRDQLDWLLGDTAGNQLVIGNYGSSLDQDFDHGIQTDPTLFIHSDTDPNTNNTQWISFSHNKVDGVLNTGLGGIIATPGLRIPDDIGLTFGDSDEYKTFFDEATDDQLINITTVTTGTADTDPLYLWVVPAGVDAGQEIAGFGVGAQTVGGNRWKLTEDGSTTQTESGTFGGSGQSNLARGLVINEGSYGADALSDLRVETNAEDQFFIIDSSADLGRFGDFDTNYLEIDIGGDTHWVGGGGLVFGNCYGDEIGWTQAAAVQNTWYDISDSDMVDGFLHNVTHDGNGQLTVTEPGYYIADWAGSFEASAANVHVQISLSVNGTETGALNHFETVGVNRQDPCSGTMILVFSGQ